MWICPLCNGLQSEPLNCSRCGHQLTDGGRLADYYTPYSPYREVDDVKLSNSDPFDAANRQCTHLFHCEQCAHQTHLTIDEQYGTEDL